MARHKPVTYQPLDKMYVHEFARHRRPRPRPFWMSLFDFLRYLLGR